MSIDQEFLFTMITHVLGGSNSSCNSIAVYSGIPFLAGMYSGNWLLGIWGDSYIIEINCGIRRRTQHTTSTDFPV